MFSQTTDNLRRNIALFGLLSFCLVGCESPWEPSAKAQTQKSDPDRAIAVDVAVARPQKLARDLEYTGTTAPARQVSLQAQIEGRLKKLWVDVGDTVESNQILANIEDDLLLREVDQAQAEKMAQRSEVLTVESQVGDAKIKVEQARLQFQQAEADVLRLQTSLNARIEQARLQVQQTQSDAARFNQLAQEGATTRQQAEQTQTTARQAKEVLRSEQASAAQQISQAKTAVKTAGKILSSAQAQVTIEQQRVAAANAQMVAQKALTNQAKTRQQYAVVRSPFQGKVLQKSSEPGNLVQPGTEILRLGDFSRIKIDVQISELQLGKVRLQQTVAVTLDAFPDQELTGVVTRISPAADPNSRLIPIEITLNNPGGKIGSGLLARVSFSQSPTQTIVVPDSAVGENSALFVVKKVGDKDILEMRTVKIGKKTNGKVEILAGLAPQERYVARSSKPLKPDSPIRLSILSEKDPS